jgi:ketosteroid isomerase-like protein
MAPVDTSTRLAIEAELTQLVSRFSHCIDSGKYQELALLFTDDGIFDRVGQVLNGRAAILEAMRNRHSYLTRHMVSNILFTQIDAQEARATMYVANFVGHGGNSELPVSFALPQPAILEFDDTYRRTADGWRIARRTARLIMKSDVPH